MNQKQIFLSLTASFMSAMAESGYSRSRIQRALEMAVKFTWDHNLEGLDPEQSAFEYAKWVINTGRPPSWLPQGFNHGYLG